MTSMSPLHRTLAVLAGAATLLAVLLSAVQVDAARKSSRASAEGSRLAVAIVRQVNSAGLRMNLDEAAAAAQEAALIRAATLTLHAGTGPLAAVAAADANAEVRLRQATEEMLGKKLGPSTLIADELRPHRAEAMVSEQNAALKRADYFGRRSASASRGLLLIVTAAALFTLAGSLSGRRPAWLATGTGIVVLCTAIGTGLLALFA
jgi:hypothetical protein